MAAPRVCVLGLGSMGIAMARRLRERGHNISVWNRSAPKVDSLISESAVGSCVGSQSAADALSKVGTGGVAILMVSDTQTVLNLVRSDGFASALKGRTLVNLTSGNADDGRTIAKLISEVADGEANYVDGAFSGNPSKALSGGGQLFLSCENAAVVEDAKPVLADLGSVTFCGKVGASRAMDYAVVDLFFANVLTFMSNAAALEREGVDMKQYFEEAGKRLSTVPAVLQIYSERMKSRDEESYNKDPTVTLDTSRSYWASRLPYNDAHGIPSHLTNMMVHLFDQASIGRDGTKNAHSGADISRLQEIVRYQEPSASSFEAADASSVKPK